MDFIASFEQYASVHDEVVPCEMLTLDDNCKMTKNEEIGETEEKNGKIPIFFKAVKKLETFLHFIKVLKMCLKKF